MKKTNLMLSLMMLLFCINSYAQDIEIDPVSGNTKGEIYVEYGHSVNIIYKHLNVFKVNPNGLLETINIEFENPEMLNVSDNGNGSPEGFKIMADVDDDDDRVSYIQDYQESYNDYILAYQKLKRLAGLHDYLKDQLKETYIRDTAQLKSNIRMTFMIAFEEEDVDTYKDELELIYADLLVLHNELQSSSPEFTANRDLFIHSETEGETTTQYILPQYQTISTSHQKIMALHNEVLENRNAITKKIYAAIELFIQIQNETFQRKENTGSITSDITLYTPRVVDFEGKVLDEMNPIRIKTTGKLKVNTSAGYLLSFIGDDNYGLRKNADGQTIGISKQRSNDLTHAVGALFHVYKTNKHNATFGLSTGISLTEETNVGFYLGLSGLFLENNRLVFTTGLSFTQQDILNTSNLMRTDEGELNFVSSDDTEIKIDSLYKPAFFFGITYNLFDSQQESK